MNCEAKKFDNSENNKNISRNDKNLLQKNIILLTIRLQLFYRCQTEGVL